MRKKIFIKHFAFLKWYFGDDSSNYHPAIEILKSKGRITLNQLIEKVPALPLYLVENPDEVNANDISDGEILYPIRVYDLEIKIVKNPNKLSKKEKKKKRRKKC